MTQKTRWAILGTGGIARATIADLQATENIDVVGIASRTWASAEAFATEFNVPGIFGSYEAALRAPDVDVVYVCTPHSVHAELSESALRAGRNVLCEKPLTLTGEEARTLQRHAKKADRMLTEALWSRYSPAYARIHELIASGDIGEITSIEADLGFVSTPAEAPRLWDVELGGGALLDIGIYPISFVYEFLGLPVSVAAQGDVLRTGVDVSETITFRYPDGVSAQMRASISEELVSEARIHTETGTLTVGAPLYASTELRWRATEATEDVVIPISLEGRGYVPMFRAVSAAIAAGATDMAEHPLADTIILQDLMDTVRERLLAPAPEPVRGA